MVMKLRAGIRNRVLAPTLPIEGYGKNATGHTGGMVHTVTSAAPTGAGSLHNILANYHSDYRLEFAENIDTVEIYGGDNGNRIWSNVTIDGFANGHMNGITITTPRYSNKSAIAIVAPYGGGTGGNILIKGLNFRGNNTDGGLDATEDDLIRIDPGQDMGVGQVGHVDGVLIHHCTFYRCSDGSLDMAMDHQYNYDHTIQNVTVQQCLFTEAGGCMLIKYNPENGNATRRVSIHHNVFVHNGERNPQIRGGLGLIDYVNNIIFQNESNAYYPLDYHQHYWQGNINPYGIKLWCSTPGPPANLVNGGSPGNPIVNVRGNAFLGDFAGTQIQVDTGASDANCYFDLQGSGADNNYWHGSNPLSASPKATPNTVDAGFEVTRHTVAELKNFLYDIGCPVRVGTDQTRLNDIVTYWPL